MKKKSNGRKKAGRKISPPNKNKKEFVGWKRIGISIAALAGVLLLAVLTVTGTYLVMDGLGKNTLYAKQQILPGEMQRLADQPASDEETLPDGTLRYKGKTYTYKKDVLTLLFMGIDKDGEATVSGDFYQGGQADALFLLVMDQKEKSVSVIGINRDTMTEISVFDRNGLYAGKEISQIALAHAYGDGKEESCKHTVEAVSRLFYDLPIHGYCALNMEAVSRLNDTIGGVDVVIPESADHADMEIEGERHKTGWNTGEQIHLMGKDAYTFIRYRDVEQAESANARLERQKQYLQAFIAQAKSVMKADLTLPITLYSEITPYMVTDITAQEAVYLAGEAMTYRFREEDLYAMEGEVKMGERFEEFYADDTALYELILKVFYDGE